MLHRRPDLIVPIRDRRQRKRYLTLRNFGWALLAAVVVFIGISIRSEMRGPTRHGYGRLFEKESVVDVERKPVEVVQEAPPPVDDATHADPMLVAPAARAQLLQDESAPTTTVVVPVTAASLPQAKGDVAVVGGPEGVIVVQKQRRKAVLSGGFGRN